MDSTWSNPDFLQQSSDEYLASLQNFLDGQDSSFTTSSFDPNASLTAFANSLQTGSSGGGAFASPGKPNNTTFDALSAFGGGNNGFPAASDIQINPSLLGSLPGYNHGLTGINTANEPSSPELTSASSSADSPASSADAPAPSTHHHQQQTGTRGSTRRVVSGGSNSAASGSGAGAGHDKRKAPQQGSGAVKDRKSVGGAGASGSTHHSHPTGEDDELERSESPELPAGKGAKGKTSERRRAQNRQAQRNFRERKEKHLKDLETRVLDLESKTQTQESENSALKAVLEQLRSENARLRVFETAFTFNYNKDVDGSAAMPQAQVFGGPAGAAAALPAGLAGPGARPLPQHQPRSTGSQRSSPSSVAADKPPTPPTAQDELDDVTAAFKFDTSSLGFGLSPGAGAPPTNAFASPLPSPPSATSNPSSAAAQQQTADDLFASFTLPSPPSLSSSTSAAAPFISSTLPSTSSAAASPYPTAQFTAYRDPLPALLGSTTAAQPGLTTFADFDTLFGVGVAGPSASSSATAIAGAGVVGAEDPLAAFLSSTAGAVGSATTSAAPSPSATLPLGASPSMFPSSHLAPSPGAGVGQGGETAVCGMIKEAQAQARKRGEKFEFDLDGLCSEMKLKATCQEAARQALKSAMAEDAAASRMTYPGRQI